MTKNETEQGPAPAHKRTHYIARWYEWRDILYAAEDNVTLADMIRQVEEVYELTKDS